MIQQNLARQSAAPVIGTNTGCGTVCKCADSDNGCYNPFTPKGHEESDDEESMGESNSDEENGTDNEADYGI